MRIVRTSGFEKLLRTVPAEITRLFAVQTERFSENARDPRLHVKTVRSLEHAFSFRITRRYRVFFYFQNHDTAIFFRHRPSERYFPVKTRKSWVIARHPVVVNNGFVYAIAGFTGTAYTSTVRYASLASRNTYWGLSLPLPAAGRRNTYWPALRSPPSVNEVVGLSLPATTTPGAYTGQNTFTAVFQP